MDNKTTEKSEQGNQSQKQKQEQLQHYILKLKKLRNDVIRYCKENKVMDGTLNQQNIAIISYLLGLLSGLGFLFSLISKKYGNFGAFIGFLGLYHNMEFVSTAAFRRDIVSIDSYLLNHSDAYHIAMLTGMIEYWIERIIFRNSSWKGFNFISLIGITFLSF